MAAAVQVFPNRQATVSELVERLAGVVAEASRESEGGELPEPVRGQVADLVDALASRVKRQQVRDPRSLFDLDDRLIELMDAVEEHHEQSIAIPESLSGEIEAYLEAYRQKVDRIVGYWRWQESIASICGRESERLTARKRAAENRVTRLKGFLLAFMMSRGIRRLEGEKAAIGRQPNSQPGLVVDDRGRIPEKFHEKSVRFDLAQLEELVALVPQGLTRARLERELAREGWETNEAAVRSALANNELVAGARMVRGEHVRVR